MFNVVLILFLATSTFSINSMEVTTKKNDLKAKNEKKDKKTTLAKSAPFGFNNKTSTKISAPIILPEYPFITAIKNNNEEVVKNFLNNPYFNLNLHRETPPFHAWIDTKDDNLLNLLLKDPRINGCLKDKNNKTASDALKESIDKESHDPLKIKMRSWKHILFARNTLDCTTDTHCKKLKCFYLHGQVKEEIILKTIKNIKTAIEDVEKKQKIKLKDNSINQNTENTPNNSEITKEQLPVSLEITENNKDEFGELPLHACYPDYATPEFMTKKIYFILSQFDKELMDEGKNI